MHIEANMGVMKVEGKFYQMTPLRVLGIATLRMGVKSLRTQNLEIHWYQRVDLR